MAANYSTAPLSGDAGGVICSNATTIPQHFNAIYSPIHVPLSLIICIVGTVANALNVVVLNQPAMRSPTNFQLTFLAVSDGLIMALYIIFNVCFLIPEQLRATTEGGAYYLLFYLVFQNILHTFSSWVIVTLAVFRLIYIRHPQNATTLCTFERARLAVILMIMLSVVLTIPYMLAHKVVPTSRLPPDPTLPAKVIIAGSPLATTAIPPSMFNITSSPVLENLFTVDYVKSKFHQKLLFWTSAIFVKALPILLMTVLSILLIGAMRASEKRRRKLKGIGKTRGKEEDENARRTINTTRMLLGIVLIFMVTYFPQSALLLLNGLLDKCFSKNVYDPLGDLMDLLTLINNGINFILYCAMSKQFRDTFLHLFVNRFNPTSHCCRPPNTATPVQRNHSNYNNINNNQCTNSSNNSAHSRRKSTENCNTTTINSTSCGNTGYSDYESVPLSATQSPVAKATVTVPPSSLVATDVRHHLYHLEEDLLPSPVRSPSHDESGGEWCPLVQSECDALDDEMSPFNPANQNEDDTLTDNNATPKYNITTM